MNCFPLRFLKIKPTGTLNPPVNHSDLIMAAVNVFFLAPGEFQFRKNLYRVSALLLLCVSIHAHKWRSISHL